jgi:hypothetical protein
MKKHVSIAVLDQIEGVAAHKKNEPAKTDIKVKNITYPANWETLFAEQLKNKAYSGTWQAFIRDALREKLLSSGVTVDQL